jgi:hypothetical protein
MKNYLLTLGILFSFACNQSVAQTPADAIMMKHKEFCVALTYDYGSWDQYWEGTTLVTNGNIGTLIRTTSTPMVTYGIIDKLNFLISTPYVKTKSTGGQLAGAEGFQDLSLALKYEAFNKKIGSGKLAVLTTGMYSTPMTNYLSDYMPYSLGLGTNEVTFRAITQYEHESGFYARGALAFQWRGTTEVERDYYYNNGSYYTAYMDVPNALNYHGVIGVWLLDYSLRLEASYVGLKSTSGDDIRKYNSPQPTNKIEFDQVGFLSQYYFKKNMKGLGLLAYYTHMFNGRNMGQFSNLGGGVTYQFNFK